MEILFLIIAVVLSLVGLVGSVLPALPGAIFSFAAILILYFLKTDLVGVYTLVIFGATTIVAQAIDYVLPAAQAKRFGASKSGLAGLAIGMILGFFAFAFVGMIVGALLGVVIGELMTGKGINRSMNSGIAALTGVFIATLVKFVISLSMTVYLFIKLVALIF